MLGDILEALACPHCGGTLELDGRIVRCASNHTFDVAREGYVNLLAGDASPHTADTPSMVGARRAFLDAGHFAPIARAVGAAAHDAGTGDVPGVLADAGAGTGYVLGAVLDAMPGRQGVALDISKHALRVAARSHERLGAVVADVWRRLPLKDRSAALVLNVFAPRNAEEFARVLAPGGSLLVVTPRADHLAELVGPLGLVTVDPRKSERLAAKLSGLFERVAEVDVVSHLELTRADAVAAVEMGPSATHVSAAEIARRADTLSTPVAATISVTVGTYRACSEQ